MGSYLEGLNKEQLEAVRHEAGPCMVLAGPGTGKTTVIVSRVISLIRNKIVPPENILVVTFSRAAANEMKDRYTQFSGAQGTGGVSFGTFHSIFYKLLRQYKSYKLEDLIDENQKFNLLRNIVRRLLPDSAEDEGHIKDIISDMEYLISTMSDASGSKPASCNGAQLARIMEEYKALKKQSDKFDYDDILYDCLCMLRENPKTLQETREEFKYILVDEFQDINALQFETIKLIACPLNNIFIVGDDDQSIYGFRGAAPNILVGFEELYPGCRKVYLKNNYRTTGNILTSALSVINNNCNRYSKNLEAVNKKGSLPVTFETEDFESEARAIASKIAKMSSDNGKFSGFAVIYRTNIQSRAIIDAFIDAGIPFITLDGMVSIYNHWIFKDIMSYLKLGTDTGSSRDIIRIINKPVRYISRDTIEKAVNRGDDLLQCIMNQSNLNRLQVNGIRELKSDLKRLGNMEPKNAVKYIRHVIGYDEYLMEYSGSRGISIKGLMETIEEIESSTAGFRSILLYMQHVEEVAEKLGEKDYANYRRNNVKLLTMHKAKGLEFDTVFICGSVEGLAPYIKDDSEVNTDFEEERRLFYVAMTRAKRELYIAVPRHRYGKTVKPSRFVEELQNGIDYSSQVHIGQRIYHRIYYTGIIKEVEKNIKDIRIKVDFDGREKELDLKTCLKNGIIRLM